ncbi:MAG: reverse transcriptase family protein [Candidatus Altimarinota bacterium]
MKLINIPIVEKKDIFYEEKEILKNGKKRIVFIPSDKLKKAQKNIMNDFKNHFFNIKDNTKDGKFIGFPINKNEFQYVYSYIKKKNIVDMVEKHIGKEFVIRIDIKSFFSSITKEMIEKCMKLFFQRNKIEIDNFDNFLNIITYKDFLPIGASTSPFISNIVGTYLIDAKIIKFLQDTHIVYSRYADDLIFSSNYSNIIDYIDKVIKVINSSGFTENENKRRVYKKGKRQLITGICVNNIKSVPIEKREEIRFYTLLIRKYGIQEAISFYNTKIFRYKRSPLNRKKNLFIDEEKFLRIINGKLNYFRMINSQQIRKLQQNFDFITIF